jgi:hypothetical protein
MIEPSLTYSTNRKCKRDNVGEFYRRYFHCIDRPWIPSKESNDTISIDTVILAWKNIVETSSFNNCQ